MRPNREVDNSRLTKDYYKNHIKAKKIITDKNQGVYIEDMLVKHKQMHDNAETMVLPSLSPKGASS